MARRERVNGHFKARVNLITCYMLFKITFLMRQPLAETQCDTVSDDGGGGGHCFTQSASWCVEEFCVIPPLMFVARALSALLVNILT